MWKLVLLILCLQKVQSETIAESPLLSDVMEIMEMNPAEVAEYYGFIGNSHSIPTEDGYRLTLYNIQNASATPNGEVIFLQHGLVDTAFTWVLNLPHQSLAYILASQGYNVWMGNFRGNTYSRRHASFNPDEYIGNFWCFTLDELALIDLPTMIDFVIYRTGVKSINYVGHSLGSTAVLMLLSTIPEYNQKLKSVNLFAPSQRLDHSQSAVITPFYYTQRFLEYFKCTEFMRHWETSGPISDYLCGENSYFSGFCNYGSGSVVGNSVNQVNDTRFPIIHSHFPGGSSTGQFLHFMQFFLTRGFCRYDYGPMENLKRYKQKTPPCYDIEKVATNVCVYYSDNDAFTATEDVQVIIEKLRKGNSLDCVHRLTSDDAVFNHRDYTYSIRAKELIYDHLIDTLKRHQAKNYLVDNTV